MIKIEDKNTYKINYVKVNTDEVNFSWHHVFFLII
jgi:hypothetical protein